MGVFIISPTEKGGLLFKPSDKLRKLTEPLSPIVFNNAWCLAHPQIHTLSVGAARPSDFDEHLKTLPYLQPGAANLKDLLAPIDARLHAEYENVLGRDWAGSWQQGLPEWSEVPGQVNVFEILRLFNLARAYEMVEYGKMRYNLLGNGGHWFPGKQADGVEKLDLAACLAKSPHAGRIPEFLSLAHALLSGKEVKRLGSH
jgi:hypothetical protein